MIGGLKVKERAEGKRISSEERTDKKVRIFPYLDKDVYNKLNRLAKACDVSPHELATDMVSVLLNNPSYITWVQDRYGVEKNDSLRVIPQVENGKVYF